MLDSDVEFKSQSLFSKPAADAEKPGRKWFKDFFADTPLVSEEEAFLSVLIGAARADDVVSPEEAQELSALALRTRTLSKLTMARIAELQKHIDEKNQSRGRRAGPRRGLRVDPRQLRASGDQKAQG